jgi:hypothetical protein
VMVHVEESLQVPRDFEGMMSSQNNAYVVAADLPFSQGSEKKAMMLSGQMVLASLCHSS